MNPNEPYLKRDRALVPYPSPRGAPMTGKSKFSTFLATRPLLSGVLLFAVAAGGAGAGVTVALARQDRPHALGTAGIDPGFTKASLITPRTGSLAEMVASVSPAVVQVQVSTKPQAAAAETGDLFQRFDDDRQRPSEGGSQGVLGSGFVIDAAGLIVTNAHVVENAQRISVKLADGREVRADLVGVDEKTDLAVLRLKEAGLQLPAIGWGDSDSLRVGDPIFAIGSPFGLGSTVTSGIVSGRGREIGEGPYDDFIQIDAAINQGNSGGPLFDSAGHVVGVNTAIYSPSDSGGSVGIGFAIPGHMVQSIVKQLVASGHVTRGQIGVAVQPVTADIADSLGLKQASGALIAGVSAGSPAARAGIRIGDIVTRFDGHAVTNARDLSRIVADSAVGKNQAVEVLRDGKPLALTVAVARGDRQLASIEPAALPVPRGGSGGSAALLGMTVAATNRELNAAAKQPALASGVMIMAVDPSGTSADRGLERGDLIIAANSVAVDTAAELQARVAAAERAGRHNVMLEVVRGDEHAFVAVPLA